MNRLGILHVGFCAAIAFEVLRGLQLPLRLRILLAIVPFAALCAVCGLLESAGRNSSPNTVVLIETLVLGGAWIGLHRRMGSEVLSRERPAKGEFSFVACIFWVFFSVMACWALLYVLAQPHGGWDAWAIWNLKARFLSRPGGGIGATFAPVMTWSHPDYPLFLPALVAHFWILLGKETVLVPALLALVFTLGSVLLLKELVERERGPAWGALAGLALLGASSFLKIGLEQIADIPLGFFLLAAFGFLRRARQLPVSHNAWIFAYGSAALAAWIKNEGAVLAILFTLLALDEDRRTGKSRRVFAWWPVGVSLAALLIVKQWVLPANDLASSMLTASLGFKATNYRRWAEIERHMFLTLWRFGHGILPALLVCRLLAGFRLSAWRERRALSYAAAGILLVGVYFGVYLLSPFNVEYHVYSSFPRLIAQVLPAILLLLFVSVEPVKMR